MFKKKQKQGAIGDSQCREKHHTALCGAKQTRLLSTAEKREGLLCIFGFLDTQRAQMYPLFTY